MVWMRSGLALVFAGISVPILAGGRDAEKFEISKQERKLLDLVNAEREKEKLPALKPNLTLCRVARKHSANMAKQGKMEHVLDDKTPFQRIKAGGYRYRYAGENIAAGDAPMEDIVKAWMESPKHRENILSKNFTETGVGLVTDPKDILYYTQVFGKPQ